ncbi:unnamed protein product [Mesocestoides corti]|uniref:protein-tyrosine-phosphatase n=1 Tax=Mesocestoides corti TaxID=53468 RepID=A0A3P6I7B9_MESCO|nr:unnamed protein product [Mesocestoides corti]
MGFRAAYPQLCWQHPEKLPDEEFVGVKGDSGLENLLDECLSKVVVDSDTSVSSGQCSSAPTRLPSSSSSCASSSFRHSSDSGIAIVSEILSDVVPVVTRTPVSRVTSAPITRPTMLIASLSFDDVMSSSSRRPSRLRPSTLSLSYSPSSSSTAATDSTLHVHAPKAAPTRSRTFDASSHSHFASSYRLLCPQSTLPVTPPPPRPLSTVSAALSAEAFESPLPTSVLPHLLLGCQADAMSADICAEYGITHVINVSADGEASPHVPAARFLRIPIHDNGKADIVPFFTEAFDFLDLAKLSGGRVLVHCFAGISRSPTLAIAYLMKTEHISFDEAYNRVKAIRPKISPNFNFIGQLTDFQKQLGVRSRTASPSSPPPAASKPTTSSRLALSSSCSQSLPKIVPVEASPTTEVPSNVAPPHISSPVVAAIAGASAKTTAISSPLRPVNTLVRRPTLKVDYTVPVVIGASKKRDRPQYLSLHPSSPSDQSTSTDAAAIVVGRRKRSRFGPLLLPSPSTAIASLDLSSPCEEWRIATLKSASPPPPPPSPRPRRLRISRAVDETRRFSLSAYTEVQKCAFSPLNQYDAPSSDIDSDVDLVGSVGVGGGGGGGGSSSSSASFSASNPTIIGSCGGGGGSLHSPTSASHRWLAGDSCRHQQATAESSCHSSLSSSSNGQHTPSFPIS